MFLTFCTDHASLRLLVVERNFVFLLFIVCLFFLTALGGYFINDAKFFSLIHIPLK